MNKILKKHKIKIALIVLVIFFLIQTIFVPKNFQEIEGSLFLIEKGENIFSISERLEENELIENRFLFNFYIVVSGNHSNLQAGQYFLDQNMSIFQIAQRIIDGETIKEVVTIPEGWNLRDIAWFFENKGFFQAEEILEIAGFPAIDYSVINDLPDLVAFQEYDFLQDKLSNVSLEGYLFPDTYELEKGFSVKDFIIKSLDNFDKKISSTLRQEIKDQNKTIFEIITMASLIEREAREINDKEIISGILWKRLQVGMPLQVDATILYFTGEKTTISKEDISNNSPYNTYQRRY